MLGIQACNSKQSTGCVLQDEALRAFVEPETLNGSNQYFCEKCACKCDAHKVSVVLLSSMVHSHYMRHDNSTVLYRSSECGAS